MRSSVLAETGGGSVSSVVSLAQLVRLLKQRHHCTPNPNSDPDPSPNPNLTLPLILTQAPVLGHACGAKGAARATGRGGAELVHPRGGLGVGLGLGLGLGLGIGLGSGLGRTLTLILSRYAHEDTPLRGMVAKMKNDPALFTRVLKALNPSPSPSPTPTPTATPNPNPNVLKALKGSVQGSHQGGGR